MGIPGTTVLHAIITANSHLLIWLWLVKPLPRTFNFLPFLKRGKCYRRKQRYDTKFPLGFFTISIIIIPFITELANWVYKQYLTNLKFEEKQIDDWIRGQKSADRRADSHLTFYGFTLAYKFIDSDSFFTWLPSKGVQNPGLPSPWNTLRAKRSCLTTACKAPALLQVSILHGGNLPPVLIIHFLCCK